MTESGHKNQSVFHHNEAVRLAKSDPPRAALNKLAADAHDFASRAISDRCDGTNITNAINAANLATSKC